MKSAVLKTHVDQIDVQTGLVKKIPPSLSNQDHRQSVQLAVAEQGLIDLGVGSEVQRLKLQAYIRRGGSPSFRKKQLSIVHTEYRRPVLLAKCRTVFLWMRARAVSLSLATIKANLIARAALVTFHFGSNDRIHMAAVKGVMLLALDAESYRRHVAFLWERAL